MPAMRCRCAMVQYQTMSTSESSPALPVVLDAQRLATLHRHLLAWFEQYGRDLPWRRTRDPYRILVSELMLQQTQVERVRPKYEAFLQQFPTLEALAQASPGEVIRAWSGLGYNRRALHLQRAARAVLEQYGGRFPDTPAALERLPGIGPYTAGAVACFAFERDVAFMDTNIRRVLTRLFAGPAALADREVLRIAAAVLPAGQGWAWNQALIELGALVCTAARPRCQGCPVRSACHAYAVWRASDAQVFDAPPPTRPARAIAERRAPFETTQRYFRGRVVELLRGLPPGAWMSLAELGPQVKRDWREVDRAWLQQLLEGLAQDGLIELDRETGRARLP